MLPVSVYKLASDGMASARTVDSVALDMLLDGFDVSVCPLTVDSVVTDMRSVDSDDLRLSVSPIEFASNGSVSLLMVDFDLVVADVLT